MREDGKIDGSGNFGPEEETAAQTALDRPRKIPPGPGRIEPGSASPSLDASGLDAAGWDILGPAGRAADLNSLDLVQLESLLCAALRKFFPFRSHSLHFPVRRSGEEPPLAAEYLPREGKLLLPLNHAQSGFLGIFVARGVESGVKKVLPLLPAAAGLCLDNLALYKAGQRDPASGLYTRECLLGFLERELERLREYFRPGAGGPAAGQDEIEDELAGSASAGLAAREGAGPDSRPDARLPIPAAGPSLAAARFSLMVIRLNGLAAVVREHGYMRAEKLQARLAAELEERKPGQAVAARSGDSEFALLLPAYGAQACRELGHKLVPALNAVRLSSELTGRKMGVSVSIGYVNCPRDLDSPGNLERMSRLMPAEQARFLLRRARLAAAMVYESLRRPAGLDRKWPFAEAGEQPLPVLSYAGILAEGGRVLQVTPLSRMVVSLGKYAGARPGQRFTVWGYLLEDNRAANASPRLVRRYKGEIVLMEVRQADSTAELVYCDDPYYPPQAGDQLILNRQEGVSYPGADAAPAVSASPFPALAEDAATGLLAYSDFLPRWCLEREKHEKSCLILTRFGLEGQEMPADFFEPAAGDLPEDSTDTETANQSVEVTAGANPPASHIAKSEVKQPEDSPGRQWERLLGRCAARFREVFGPRCLYGRYALNSLIAFVPDREPGELAKLAEDLGRELREAEAPGRLQCAFGLAPHPFLDFRKADALENAQKALEYALLLPEPHVGVLDSLALNISADRRFSLGDQLGAISEYKKALLCDEDNILAWNSLGVTLAGLGRHSEARRSFEAALRRAPDDFGALYNLGQLCQSLGEFSEARRLFEHCLDLDPKNVYALYRLGQLAEQRGDNPEAKKFYNRALELPGGQILTRRSLARLAVKEGRLEEAREELHEALLINPNDALALQLLAGLYLDAGEDPRVAESLARQSAALRPDLKSAWLELARALEAVGKSAEAREALLKAGEL